MKYELNNQEVEVNEVDYADNMAIVVEAYYIDSEIALTEDELLVLEDKYQEELAQDAYEHMVDAAHDSMDTERE